MTAVRKWPMICREFTGAGYRGFSRLPSGATTWMGRLEPSFFGVLGVRAHLMGYSVYAVV